MRVVIACCGLEHVVRGYESAGRELFDALSGHLDVVLCKGSGKRGKNEVVVPCLRRDFLERFISPAKAFYWEQMTFALGLLPYLLLHKVDIVHYSEARFGNALVRLVRWTGLKTRLLYSNGGPHSPARFHPGVFILQVCGPYLQAALDFGIPAERMRLLPYGIAPEQFRLPEGRAAAREQFHLPPDKLVILSMAALSRTHKRIDYLIREVAALNDDSIVLCMAGQETAETPEMRALAEELLPGRHRFLTVPRARVPALLAAADLVVLASLREGFGMVLIEACSAGVPVICHDWENFRWVLGDAAVYADMETPGALAASLRMVARDSEKLRALGVLGRARVDQHYSWRVLVPRYLEMYRSILDAPGA